MDIDSDFGLELKLNDWLIYQCKGSKGIHSMIKQNLSEQRFYMLWFLMNSILIALLEYAVILTFFMFAFSGGVGGGGEFEIFLVTVVIVSIPAAILGIGQWLILKRYFPQNGFWVVATILGWCIGSPMLLWTIGYELGGGLPIGLVTVVAIFIGGMVGTSQWLVMRHWRYSGWWIVIVLLDLSLSLLVGRVVNNYLENLGVPIIAFGFLTGWGVIWLSRRQASTPTILK